MGLHKFNKDLELKKLKYKQNKSKYIKVGTLVLSVFILVMGIIYFTYSKFTTTNKFDVVNAKVGEFVSGDYTIAAYLDGEKSNTIPAKTDGYVVDKIECNNSATATWDETNWGILITGSTTSGTKCNVYFVPSFAKHLVEAAGGTTAIAAKGTPNFANTATTDEGMYATTDDYGTSYYYRGAVTTNNVIFGGFCWKVIRINGDGTTRMIYNGTPSNNQCTTTTGTGTKIDTSTFNPYSNDNAYVGYMYGTAGSTTYEATHANTNSSTAKTAIDTWYNTNLSSYSSKISDTLFCNDRSLSSGTGIGTTETYYGAYNRYFNTHVPALTCQNKNDRFTVSDTTTGNGNLTNPVGLITMDEVGFAGTSMSSYDANNSYYLYTNQYYLTMSLDFFFGSNAYEFTVFPDGNFGSGDVRVTYGLRPVINLNSDVQYTSGDGTSTSPYVIS